jgi:hypothetical protein
MLFPSKLCSAGALACIALLSLSAFAAEKKEETKKPGPPSVSLVLPLAITPGTTNKVKVRGLNLTNVSEVKFTGSNFHPVFTIQSKGKAEVPKEMDAKKVGDTQVELQLILPADTAPGPQPFSVVSPEGESKPATVVVVAAAALLKEKEPNNSFRDAQPVGLGKSVQGAISEAKEVDVFQLNCKADQMVVAELQAARLGSTLDSILTLYDAAGHQLAASDDSASDNDSVLRIKVPKAGTYFLSLMDAHDKGGVTYAYLLTIREE